MAHEVKDIEKKETQAAETVERTAPRPVYKPRIDIVEREHEIVMYADMPGVDEKNVDITLEKNELTIHGRASRPAHGDDTLVHREYGFGDYERVFTLSNEIDFERIEASVSNGILKLVLPKAEEAKTRKISVKHG